MAAPDKSLTLVGQGAPGAPMPAASPILELTPEQIELIKRTIARDATDDEMALFLYTARRLGLDPLARQIHFVKRRQRAQDGTWVEVGAIQVAIDGFRVVAERSGKYAGQVGPEWCGKDGQWRSVWLSSEPPAAARVGVLRSDFREPVWGIARWDSYVPLVRDKGTGKLIPSAMWAKMPDLMLAKCAEALALRKAFPQDLSGVYVHEEMDKAASEHEVVDAAPVAVYSPAAPLQTGGKTQLRQQSRGQDDHASDAQIRALWGKSKAAGATSDDMREMIRRRYGVESSRDLTRRQASELLDNLARVETGDLTLEDLFAVPEHATQETEPPHGRTGMEAMHYAP